MSECKSQEGSGSGEEKPRGGDYIMLTREVLKVLLRPNLTTHEKSIILHIVDRTIGYHCQFREFSAEDFMRDLNLTRPTVFRSLSRLAKEKILLKRHIGNRCYEYGLNQEFFNRIYPGDISNVRYLDRYKEAVKSQGRDHKVSPETLHSISRDTGKVRKPNAGAGLSNIKHSSNIVLNISLSRFKEFLDKQPRTTRSRWERFLGQTLEKHPGDEELLHCAIDLVHRDKKDMFGTPIHSSIIGLFEKSDWDLMRAALERKLKKEEEENKKKAAKEETERLAREKRERMDKEMAEHSPERAAKEIGKILSMMKGLPA